MSNKPLLFYSQKDANSINLWKRLQSDGNLNNFIKICVDNNNKIPSMVTTVPSIFVKGRPLIYGPGINMFLNSPMASGGSNSQSGSVQPQSRPNFQQAPNQVNNHDAPPEIESSTNNLNGISDFNAVEMGGAWSDKYSFIQDNPAPMSYCYQFLDGVKDNQITGQAVQGNNMQQDSGRKNNSMFENRLQQLQQERNNIYNR